jgi:hypothetical protein
MDIKLRIMTPVLLCDGVVVPINEWIKTRKIDNIP